MTSDVFRRLRVQINREVQFELGLTAKHIVFRSFEGLDSRYLSATFDWGKMYINLEKMRNVYKYILFKKNIGRVMEYEAAIVHFIEIIIMKVDFVMEQQFIIIS